MPYVKIDPAVFMGHNGVLIYHVYRDGTDECWDYWYTTNPETADDSFGHGQGGHFDARQFTGLWSDTPNVDQWDRWWKPRFKHEGEAVRALIRTAIDEGKITSPAGQSPEDTK